jgi:hypothetical protein
MVTAVKTLKSNMKFFIKNTSFCNLYCQFLFDENFENPKINFLSITSSE